MGLTFIHGPKKLFPFRSSRASFPDCGKTENSLQSLLCMRGILSVLRVARPPKFQKSQHPVPVLTQAVRLPPIKTLLTTEKSPNSPSWGIHGHVWRRLLPSTPNPVPTRCLCQLPTSGQLTVPETPLYATQVGVTVTEIPTDSVQSALRIHSPQGTPEVGYTVAGCQSDA